MTTSSVTQFPVKPHDPREADVMVRVDPDVDPWLLLNPGIMDGATDASIHRARVSQQIDRNKAIANALEREAEDLTQTCLLDTVHALKVANVLPFDICAKDRRDAGAVAVRLHDPRWQIVSRYHAADALLVRLRKACHEYGWYATDRQLRELADDCAGISHLARLKVWTNQIITDARTWTRCALGFLSIREER